MSDVHFPLTADDGGPDDLPRTLRRERDARDRQARERAGGIPSYVPERETAGTIDIGPAQPATVTGLDIPFVRLMVFFIKAVFAAIPALIILGALIWLSGEILTAFFPQLIKMQILIRFPN